MQNALGVDLVSTERRLSFPEQSALLSEMQDSIADAFARKSAVPAMTQ